MWLSIKNERGITMKRILILAFALILTTQMPITAYAKNDAKKNAEVYVLTQDGSYRYSYNKSGFVSKDYDVINGKLSHVYKYDADKIQKATSITSNGKIYTVWNYNKKGVLKSRVTEMTKTNPQQSYFYKYDSKGKLKEIRHGNEKTYYIYNSKNTISQIKDGFFEYNFDNRGNVNQVTDFTGSTPISLTYDDNGNLIKEEWKESYESDETGELVVEDKSCNYSYKKISVPKEYVKAIKEQQWKIRNGQDWNILLY